MSTYKNAPAEVLDIADELMARYESHASLSDKHVKIDFLFAFAARDEVTGEISGDALTHGGIKALGIARKLGAKDRAKGLGDAEICLDGDWWETHDREEQEALLDHELHHLCATNKVDDLGRPIIKLRKHDYQFGWFTVIAERHGVHSQERKQAASIMEIAGQFYFPEMFAARDTGSRFRNLEIHRLETAPA